MFNKGISKTGSLLDVAVDHEIVTKAGAWYQYEGEQIGQGRENAKTFLEENPETADEIERRIKAVVFPEDDGSSEEAAEEAGAPEGGEEQEAAETKS